MFYFIAGVVLATVSFYRLEQLPQPAGFIFLWGLATLFWLVSLFFSARLKTPQSRQFVIKGLNLVSGVIIGGWWLFGQSFFMTFLLEKDFSQPVQVVGELVESPHVENSGQRIRLSFFMDLQEIAPAEQQLNERPVQSARHFRYGFRPRIQLSWYLDSDRYQQLSKNHLMPKAGETWAFFVKLKPNHAWQNPGSFDYETWRMQKGIRASGYVLQRYHGQVYPDPQVLSTSRFSDLRGELMQVAKRLYMESDFQGVYRALTLGDRSDISQQDWRLMQTTGTVHLMAISGMHMSIMAWLGYQLFAGIWWLGAYRVRRWQRPQFAIFGAVMLATFYLLISGAAIPTQRAWLMVMAGLLFLALQRTFQAWVALAWAIFAVIIWDSASVLSLGFWLSFLAVALIFVQLPVLQRLGRWKGLFYLQIWLSLAFIPVTAWAFHAIPTYSFLANLIAVPLVGFVILPLSLVALITAVFWQQGAIWLVELNDKVMSVLWSLFATIDSWPHSLWVIGDFPLIALLLCYLLLIYGWCNRTMVKGMLSLGLAFGLIMASIGGAFLTRPEEEAFRMTVLDVGQGQSLVIETRNHLVVYDTGPKLGNRTDAARIAAIPYIKFRGWSKIDYLLVSHSDIDHAGGVQSLLDAFTVGRALTGQPLQLNHSVHKTHLNPLVNFQTCEAGTRWQLDGVAFSFLSPWTEEGESQKLTSDNDRSCVLKVTTGDNSVLIPGDYSSKAEQQLLLRSQKDLPSQILIAGHHGSRYSTSRKWLQAIDPEYVIFSSGYSNRFDFPNQETIQRLADKVAWWNTACSGALTFNIDAERIALQMPYRQQQAPWYRHQCSPELQGRKFQVKQE
ncbi:DNA internalization-related competence protein ComEC/Rec2 [Thiomicrorhabdus sp.]|uniref:DNA internalization-related competence protein ComEC/Rec2 n=1 Tax=Thiomicrorhabdus sp. TaxID=2039724 RepID=UPI0029C9759E|nr:DNA internalization-related competence protein ComEC/Rec2 [Thiomicrorhabdus sp.]